MTKEKIVEQYLKTVDKEELLELIPNLVEEIIEEFFERYNPSELMRLDGFNSVIMDSPIVDDAINWHKIKIEFEEHKQREQEKLDKV